MKSKLSAFKGYLIAPAIALPLLLAEPAAAATPGPVSIPQDESPHPSSSMEWWYFTGHLTGKDLFGQTHNYGFEQTFIRIDALALAPISVMYNGQFAITDLTRQTYKANENVYTLQPDYVPPGGGFNNTVGTWNMAGINGKYNTTAGFFDGSYVATLHFEQSTPPALHGGQGIIPYGVFGTSAYYSYTNLKASGVIWDHGMPVTVTGIAWQDHQYGDFLAGPGGWDWFSIQLTNGTQYMLYFLRDGSNNIVQKVGTKVNPNGTTVNLNPNQLSVTALGTWASPSSGITYSQNWKVTVPEGTMTATAQYPNQELISILSSTGDYWEGASTVSGTLNGVPVAGSAYVELTPHITLPTRGLGVF